MRRYNFVVIGVVKWTALNVLDVVVNEPINKEGKLRRLYMHWCLRESFERELPRSA
jgi:hypothetical protein